MSIIARASRPNERRGLEKKYAFDLFMTHIKPQLLNSF
jgi:hypothetical protein